MHPRQGGHSVSSSTVVACRAIGPHQEWADVTVELRRYGATAYETENRLNFPSRTRRWLLFHSQLEALKNFRSVFSADDTCAHASGCRRCALSTIPPRDSLSHHRKICHTHHSDKLLVAPTGQSTSLCTHHPKREPRTHRP